jgi:hypothetical protein
MSRYNLGGNITVLKSHYRSVSIFFYVLPMAMMTNEHSCVTNNASSSLPTTTTPDNTFTASFLSSCPYHNKTMNK